MIEEKALIRGGSVYVKNLGWTYSKTEIQSMPYEEQKQLLGFIDENKLDKVRRWSTSLDRIVSNIYERL